MGIHSPKKITANLAAPGSFWWWLSLFSITEATGNLRVLSLIACVSGLINHLKILPCYWFRHIVGGFNTSRNVLVHSLLSDHRCGNGRYEKIRTSNHKE